MNKPSWYPLQIDTTNHHRVVDANGYTFAMACSTEAAALIALTMNESARRDFADVPAQDEQEGERLAWLIRDRAMFPDKYTNSD